MGITVCEGGLSYHFSMLVGVEKKPGATQYTPIFYFTVAQHIFDSKKSATAKKNVVPQPTAPHSMHFLYKILHIAVA